jgi:periplasmic protein CpxP/Spy
MEAMRSDTSTSRDDKRAKMQSMHQASTQKIEAVMTDEQKQKYEADQQKMQERRAQHRHGGMSGPEGAPPSDAGQPPAPPQ